MTYGRKRLRRYPHQVTVNLPRKDYEKLRGISLRNDVALSVACREAIKRGIDAAVKAANKGVELWVD